LNESHSPERADPEVATTGPGAGAEANVMVFSRQPVPATRRTREPPAVRAVAYRRSVALVGEPDSRETLKRR
jgi:hypothetical protein